MTNTTPTPDESISTKVMESIDAGQAKMHSKYFFVAKGALLVTGVLAISLVTVYLLSFAVFMMRVNGVALAPTFGWRAFPILFSGLPWLVVTLVLVFIMVLELLVYYYPFAYRQPLLFSAIAVIAVVGLVSVVVGKSVIHEQIEQRVRAGHWPVMETMYRVYGERPVSMLYPGQIVAVSEHGFALRGRRGEVIDVIVTPETMVVPGVRLEPGSTVIIFGESSSDDQGQVRAVQIRPFAPEERFQKRIRPQSRHTFMLLEG